MRNLKTLKWSDRSPSTTSFLIPECRYEYMIAKLLQLPHVFGYSYDAHHRLSGSGPFLPVVPQVGSARLRGTRLVPSVQIDGQSQSSALNSSAAQLAASTALWHIAGQMQPGLILILILIHRCESLNSHQKIAYRRHCMQA